MHVVHIYSSPLSTFKNDSIYERSITNMCFKLYNSILETDKESVLK